MPTISIFEHASLFVGESRKDISGLHDVVFRQEHFDALAARLGNKDEEVFPFYSLAKDRHRDGIRFKQYVGVIQAKNLTIEILPKTDRGNEQYWRGVLLFMLRQVYKLNIRTIDYAPQSLRKSSILDLFIARFLDETERLIHMGLIKTYRKKDECLLALKGKLLLAKQFSMNAVHQERFFVRHSIFDRGHIMNRILRQTLLCISEMSTKTFLQQRAAVYLAVFPELEPVNANDELFSKLLFDRKSVNYREAITLARLILLNNLPDLSSGKYETMAMLFDMNRLWERFVYVTLRKYLKDYLVRDQVRRDFWESPLRAIRPDIVVRKDNEIYILDTKWKRIEKTYPADADLHQMYVYFHYFKARKVALIYPSYGEASKSPLYGTFQDEGKGSCDMIFLPVIEGSGPIWQKAIADYILKWLTTRQIEGREYQA